MTWPAPLLQPSIIHTFGALSAGLESAACGAFRVASCSSTTYPAANTALYFPFWLASPIVAVQLWAFNGATASGNIDLGLYAADGTRLVSIGSTAQATTSDLQSFDITDTELGPGLFYLAVAMDNTTGTLFRANMSAALGRSIGAFEQTSAFALPATATFATFTPTGFVPVIGLATTTVY